MKTMFATAQAHPPIYDVLVGPQKSTPSLTTLFSFVDALRTAQPAAATTIDGMLAGRSISGGVADAWGTGETRDAPGSGNLPVYRDLTVGGGSVWTAELREGGSLVRIDPQTVSIAERIPLPSGSNPENLVFFEESVWVANNFGKTVSRYTPAGNEMVTIKFPERAVFVSAGGGFVWVAMVPPRDAEVDLSRYAVAKVDPKTNAIAATFPTERNHGHLRLLRGKNASPKAPGEGSKGRAHYHHQARPSCGRARAIVREGGD